MRLVFTVGVLALLPFMPIGEAAAAPVTYTLSGSAGSNGWFTSNVTVRWTVVDNGDLVRSTCPLADQITAEGTSTRQCTTEFTWGTVVSPPEPLVVRIDKSPPSGVIGTLARSPDSGDWYNRPVTASFTGEDAVSGIATCTSPSYGGGDGASVTVSGTCTDVAGNTSAPVSLALRYDATPPTVAATADRAPDGRGWYRRPVIVSFSGTDGVSGIAGCTAPTRYAGPDRDGVEIAGTCRDAAGNTAPESKLQLQYDATAPALAGAAARLERGAARVTWKRPADATAIEIERTPGVNGRTSTIVYQGRGDSFLDKTVRTGARYRYEIRAVDAAGNVGRRTVTTAPASPLRLPAAGAVVRAPVALAWSAVAGARFYNVQLYRGREKILSAWPRGAALRLARTWLYAGKRQRLAPGLYRWYVWPARGTRERPRYGRALGSSTFVVRG